MQNCNCDKNFVVTISLPYRSARALHKVRDVTMSFWRELKMQALMNRLVCSVSPNFMPVTILFLTQFIPNLYNLILLLDWAS